MTGWESPPRGPKSPSHSGGDHSEMLKSTNYRRSPPFRGGVTRILIFRLPPQIFQKSPSFWGGLTWSTRREHSICVIAYQFFSRAFGAVKIIHSMFSSRSAKFSAPAAGNRNTCIFLEHTFPCSVVTTTIAYPPYRYIVLSKNPSDGGLLFRLTVADRL